MLVVPLLGNRGSPNRDDRRIIFRLTNGLSVDSVDSAWHSKILNYKVLLINSTYK